MKRIFLPLALLVLSIPSFGRVICDTTCHAPEDEFKNFADADMFLDNMNW